MISRAPIAQRPSFLFTSAVLRFSSPDQFRRYRQHKLSLLQPRRRRPAMASRHITVRLPQSGGSLHDSGANGYGLIATIGPTLDARTATIS